MKAPLSIDAMHKTPAHFFLKTLRSLSITLISTWVMIILAGPACYVERSGTKRSPINGQGMGNNQGGEPPTGGIMASGGNGGEAGIQNPGSVGGSDSMGGENNTGGLDQTGGAGGLNQNETCSPYDENCECNTDNDCIPTPCFENARCADNRICEFDRSPNCCSVEDTCIDEDPSDCRTYQCNLEDGMLTGTCEASFVERNLNPECCENNSDCNALNADSNDCTISTCDPDTFVCGDVTLALTPEGSLFDGCCRDSADCGETGEVCTEYQCNNNRCEIEEIEDCCRDSADCEEQNQNFCSETQCLNNRCTNIPIGNCCIIPQDCVDDGNICTQTQCINNRCANMVIENCCQLDRNAEDECNDYNDCTVDSCIGPGEPGSQSEIFPTCLNEISEREIELNGQNYLCCQEHTDCRALFNSPQFPCIGVRCVSVANPNIGQEETRVCEVYNSNFACFPDDKDGISDEVGDTWELNQIGNDCRRNCINCSFSDAECNEDQTIYPPPGDAPMDFPFAFPEP